ncbi:MAG: bifunctional phosphopantothenoylcysteine decarboxylase/phosphopantothenate--cysteine ligase CoaBC [Desulfarculaceae bacterium]|jgi:phosphopantothenoylcysteine decarboxylase/phosphopantothenate--cysteine ligase
MQEDYSAKARVLLGVTGGIAAYKAAELASLLTKQGMAVRVVMTEAAREFVGPITFTALTGRPVAGDMFDPGQEAAIGHIELARWAQVVVVAPATANFLAKAALGLADDLLSTVMLATRAKIIVAPAMNPQMYAHPTVAENLERLKGRGVRIVGPAAGTTACGEEGPGRMAEPEEIAREIKAALFSGDLKGFKILVTAGPTREHLDPVRYISNPSTGRQGLEVARAARARGAEVTLVLGPTHLQPPEGVKTVAVISAEEMYQAVMAEASDADAVIKAAAVSDFRPVECAPQKVKKNGSLEESCRLESTKDILAELGRQKDRRILVGFAAESESLLDNARQKLKKKNLDLLVANDISRPDTGFASDTNQVHLITSKGEVESLPLMSKREVADLLCERLAQMLNRPGA